MLNWIRRRAQIARVPRPRAFTDDAGNRQRGRALKHLLLLGAGRALVGERLERYVAQRRVLALISCGARYAIASWDGLSAEGRWLWRLKDRIDRGWIAHFNG